jgi:hypothetical protein
MTIDIVGISKMQKCELRECTLRIAQPALEVTTFTLSTEIMQI